MTDVDERARDVLVRWAGTNVPHEFESLDAAIAAAMALGGGTRMQAEATVESATGDAPVSEKPVPEDEAAPMESDEEEPVAEPEKPATGRDRVKTSAEQRVEEAKKRRKGAARGRRGDAIRAARRRSSRHSRPPFESAISAVVNSLGPPTYTPSGVRGAGGRHSVAALGPIELTEWSRTASLPKALGKLKKAAPECGFVSGHLLNATFGGDGLNADNLTVLSRQGNANCRGFDDALKPAFVELRNAYRAMFNDGVDFASDPLRINIDYQAFHDAMYAVRAAIHKANEHGNVENPP